MQDNVNVTGHNWQKTNRNRVMTGRQRMSQKGGKRREERRGKAESLVGKTGSMFTWWGAVIKLQALLASEQQATWQKLAHSRDRLPGEFYQAPSAEADQTCSWLFSQRSLYWTTLIQSDLKWLLSKFPHRSKLVHCTLHHLPHLSRSRFSSVGVSLGETGSPMVSPPPSPTGDTSPPSDTLGGSKRLVDRPKIFGRRRGEGMRCYTFKPCNRERMLWLNSI